MTITNGITIQKEGMAITGGVTLFTDGFTITGGLTLFQKGLFITTSGLNILSIGLSVNTLKVYTIPSALLVYQGGMTISDLGMTVTGGISLYSGLQTTAGVTIFTGGVTILDTVNVGYNGIFVTGGVTVFDSGLSIYSGNLKVGDKGMKISGGLQMLGKDFGLQVTNGATVYSGGAIFSSARLSFGLKVTGDLNVNADVNSPTTQIWGSGLIVALSPYLVNTGGGAKINSISDRRLKKSITNLKNSLKVVSSLRGVYFNWRNDFESSDLNNEIGLIAQEVQRVIPSAVKKVDGERLAIKYGSMIPIIIDAINELQNRDSESTEDILKYIRVVSDRITELELDDAYRDSILSEQEEKIAILKDRLYIVSNSSKYRKIA